MAKTIFEEMGGTYTQVGDYFTPDLKLPKKETQPVGIWGQHHLRYIKHHKRLLYAKEPLNKSSAAQPQAV